MVGGFNGGPDFADGASGVDEEGDAVGAHVFAAHEAFFAPDAVVLHDFFVSVGEESEGKGVFLDEFLVGFGGVGADADDFCSEGFDFCVIVAKAAGFGRAAGGVVFGIEVENDPFVFGKGPGIAVLVDAGDWRSGVAFFEF